jgi:SAM-dependent methyltransferase
MNINRKSIKSLWGEINRLNKHSEILQAERDLAAEQIRILENKMLAGQNYFIHPKLAQIVSDKILETLSSDDFRDTRLHPFVREGFELLVNKKAILNEKNNLDVFLDSEELNKVFRDFGSDKGDRHNYGSIYQKLIGEKKDPLILEIGIGTENHYMYASGLAGSSLKAWREFYPNGLVIGADIDPEAISSVEPPAYIVDQTKDDSLETLATSLKQFGKFDLIVDDGFHDFHANVRTFLNIYPILKPGGHYIIEDVHESMIEIWTIVGGYLGLNLMVFDLREYREGVNDNILVVIKKDQ